MKRLILLFFLTTGVFADDTLSGVWNRFVATAHEWIEMIGAHPPGAVSVQEYQAWFRVKQQWRTVEKSFNQYYKAER